MAWIPRYTRNGIEYGGTYSQYYWNSSINPNATFQLCLANCTTYAYGRVKEEGLPAPVTRIRDADLWHTVVNTSAGWSLLSYTQGMTLYPGDIVEWAAMHVAVVETTGTNPTVSGSWYTDDNGTAYGTRSTSVMGSTLQSVSNWMIANYPYRFFHSNTLTTENSNAGGGPYPVYVLRYTGSTPTPTTPSISISPSSYSVTMSGSETYVDFAFDITIDGIPSGESASGGNTYSGLSRIYNTGWSYTDYTVSGTTYRRATKSQTLRYTRENDAAYTTTKYMVFSKTFSNGSINSSTQMYINVQERDGGDILTIEIAAFINGKKQKKFTVKLI